MKKYLAVILCVIVLASFPLRSAPAHAVGPALVIAGSTVINGSIAALIASIVAQPMGLVDSINASAEAAGVRAVDHLEGLLRDYATSAQIPITSIYSLLNAGVMYAANGAITLSEDASEFFGDFFSWAHSEEGGNLQQYDTPVVGDQSEIDYSGVDTSSVGGFVYDSPIYVSSAGRYEYGSNWYDVETTSGVIVTIPTGFIALSETPCTLTVHYKSGSTSTHQSSALKQYGITYYRAQWSINFNSAGSLSPALSTNGNMWQTAYMIFHGQMVGESPVNTYVYAFDPSTGYNTNIVYAGDVVAVPDFGDPSKPGTADIAGWLGGVSDVIYTGAGTISVTDDQGVTADYDMTKSGVDEMQITKTAADTVDQVIGGTVSGVGSGTVQGELGDYTLDLRDFFPFCIPFDIYRMLSLFAASREAPHVEWRFLVPGIVDQTIDIDLSVFDNVAATLRSVELVAAAIGLALMTKRLIQGGD